MISFMVNQRSSINTVESILIIHVFFILFKLGRSKLKNLTRTIGKWTLIDINNLCKIVTYCPGINLKRTINSKCSKS